MDFVDFDLAKKLKEKGFKEQCLAYYSKDTKFYYNTSYGSDVESAFKSFNSRPNHICGKRVDAPTISKVLKWLRKEKEIYCLPYFEQGIDMWLYSICRPNAGCEFPEFISESIFNDYEQAAIAGIEYVLNHLIEDDKDITNISKDR